MPTRLHLLLVLAGTAALSLACESGPAKSLGPSTVENAPPAAVAQPVQLAATAIVQHVVTLFDACDPETFNAALGPGTCTRSGGVRFERFVEQVGLHHSIGGWHFAPPDVTMRVGQLLVATNRGGEVHTFTEVEEFGGGIVPLLNELTGMRSIAPECTHLTAGDFLAPGASSSEEEEDAGIEKYQCCIHPWMRAEVRVTPK